MEFLLFLGAKEIEIINILKRANYDFEENTPLCLLGKEYVGFFKRPQRKMVICTDNAKIKGGYFIKNLRDDDNLDKTAIYIRRAVRHESVHIAQHCNNGDLIKVSSKRVLKIHPYKLKALSGSTNITGKKEHEYQAYTLEDKPKIVIEALKRYCL